jgi:phosphocarrier protein HPr
VNKLGLHARASAKLTQLAGSLSLRGLDGAQRRRINAKSIMGVMMLAAGKGSSGDHRYRRRAMPTRRCRQCSN